MDRITAPRGTRDILDDQAYAWFFLSAKAREIFGLYGYREIITPTFESTKLFKRGIGEGTDIVQKEMYTFKDKADRDLTLRPEGTASIVRAYIQHSMNNLPQPVKLFYIGQMYRYERPQAGRYREFTQIGIEALGSDDPAIDAEVIQMLVSYLQEVGLNNFVTYINSMGCQSDRERFTAKLLDYLSAENKLCKECVNRSKANPLRVFDCKDPGCQEFLENAPKITDFICDKCVSDFDLVQKYLNAAGVQYLVDKKLVRGFDYYSKTAFEMRVKELGAQDAVAGGGRYDKLVEQFGGPRTPSVGFAIGLDRLYLALGEKPQINKTELYLAKISQEQTADIVGIANSLRKKGIGCDMDFMGRSLKAQLKHASKIGAKFVAVIGPDEITSGTCRIKQMDTGQEKEIKITEIYGEIIDKRH